MKDTRKRKTKKGDFGYFSRKKRRFLITKPGYFLFSYFLRGVGRQRNKNDSLDGSDCCRLSSRL